MTSLYAAEGFPLSEGALFFLIGMFLLVAGYFLYGKVVERILGPDDRPTPALTDADGVDYLVLPHWKNMLIQLLNIAGIGPVIGVILGIKFGPVVFLAIPIGNIFGGAVHDFVAGMMSLRNNGSNLPRIMNQTLGRNFYIFMCVFMILLLLLVVAVFINVPAKLLDGFAPELPLFWVFVGSIFLYYIVATLFPIDKIIGRIYPIFGAMLLVGTGAVLISLLWQGILSPAKFLVVTDSFQDCIGKQPPLIPCLFVTIACGIMSGFHATQSPIVARTMKTERQARSTFYGMMVVEGLIAMTWAAAGFMIYTLFPADTGKDATFVLRHITDYYLGSGFGTITILAVVVLAITSGDTAMRCIRLSLGEILHITQKPFSNRLLICVPLILAVAGLLYWSDQGPKAFGFLWNYFAWGNQVLAASTLCAGTVWLLRQKKNAWITILPGMFMTFVVISYILWTSKEHGGPAGFGLDLKLAYVCSFFITLSIAVWCWVRGSLSASLPPEVPASAVRKEIEEMEDAG